MLNMQLQCQSFIQITNIMQVGGDLPAGRFNIGPNQTIVCCQQKMPQLTINVMHQFDESSPVVRKITYIGQNL
jgi:hypothetical protein